MRADGGDAQAGVAYLYIRVIAAGQTLASSVDWAARPRGSEDCRKLCAMAVFLAPSSRSGIPPDPYYDDHRARLDAWLITRAARRWPCTTPGTPTGSPAASGTRGPVPRVALACGQADAGAGRGGGPADLAVARALVQLLARAGRHADAVAVAAQAWAVVRNDPQVLLEVAVPEARRGRQDEALRYLRSAVARENDGAVLAMTRRSPTLTLAGLRAAKPAEVADLTTPKYTWWIEYGLLADDVLVRNDSAFAVTGVTLTPTVMAGGPAGGRAARR